MLAERQPETLLSTTNSNPREHVKVIILRSGKQLSSSLPMVDDDVIVQDEPVRKEPEPEVIELVRTEDKKKSLVREYQTLIPYLARSKQEKVDQKLKDLGLVTLNEECSAILQNKLPMKRHDPGSFTIPYIIGDLLISDALADLGVSINLMSSSLFEKLALNEPKPTRMSIQLANRTMKYPRGIVEDVFVKVDKFIFPVDFIVMDMEGESSMPLFLRRLFLATSRAVIDVCDGKLQLRVDDKTITFDLSTSIRYSFNYDNTVYFVDDILESQLQEILLDDPL
ncbi:uncharacterized protein LOC125369333 [Ricinus communis]|uniref:uncharacterized protein LOC125369333 n=1 Tax=Ricinus communis TaxID=3988 RepID=UPI00201AF3FA|nr:uncharacterized protein LOC125369333 [Ricinus communis]